MCLSFLSFWVFPREQLLCISTAYCIHQLCFCCQMLHQKCQLLLEAGSKCNKRCPGDSLTLMVAKFKFLIRHVSQKPTQLGFFQKLDQHYTDIISQGDAKINVPAEVQMDWLLLAKHLKLASEAHCACSSCEESSFPGQ